MGAEIGVENGAHSQKLKLPLCQPFFGCELYFKKIVHKLYHNSYTVHYAPFFHYIVSQWVLANLAILPTLTKNLTIKGSNQLQNASTFFLRMTIKVIMTKISHGQPTKHQRFKIKKNLSIIHSDTHKKLTFFSSTKTTDSCFVSIPNNNQSHSREKFWRKF